MNTNEEILNEQQCEQESENNSCECQEKKQSEGKSAKKCQRKEKVNDKKAAELEEKLKESEDKYLRMLAEYDNFRKRAQKEKEAIYSDAVCDSVEKLLEVLDNLERAAGVDVSKSDAQSVVDGVVKILTQAKEVFSKLGVEEIAAKGEQFNPEVHNAVMHEENEEFGENTVSEVFLKGYKRGDKVIRHSMVKVAN